MLRATAKHVHSNNKCHSKSRAVNGNAAKLELTQISGDLATRMNEEKFPAAEFVADPAKEAYSTPELREYGDLRDITMALNTTNHADGGLLLTLLQLLRTSGLIL